jgi:enamine deaminase RidA (YjgF/YER057c/UK114 family)
MEATGMSNENGWAARIEAATAGTMHEQLRTLTLEAREALGAVSQVVREQGALLADVAQRTAVIEAAIASTLERLSVETADDRRRVAEDMAHAREADRRVLAEAGAAIAAEFRTVADGFTDSLEIMRAEIETFCDRITKHTDSRIDGLRAELAAGFDAINARVAALEDGARGTRVRTDDGVTIAFG